MLYCIPFYLRRLCSEIVQALAKYSPLVKPMHFVGQASTTNKGFSQKKQAAVVKVDISNFPK